MKPHTQVSRLLREEASENFTVLRSPKPHFLMEENFNAGTGMMMDDYEPMMRWIDDRTHPLPLPHHHDFPNLMDSSFDDLDSWMSPSTRSPSSSSSRHDSASMSLSSSSSCSSLSPTPADSSSSCSPQKITKKEEDASLADFLQAMNLQPVKINVWADALLVSGKFVMVSPEFASLMRCSMTELHGENWQTFVPFMFRMYYVDRIREMHRNGASSCAFEIILNRKDKSSFICQMSYSCMPKSCTNPKPDANQEIIQISLESVRNIPPQTPNFFSS